MKHWPDSAKAALTRYLVDRAHPLVLSLDAERKVREVHGDGTHYGYPQGDFSELLELIGNLLVGADVFLGVSGGTVPEKDIARMAGDAIVFALANPNPEVHPEVAHRHAAVVATGRSDYPNQINNVLAFPGIFRGALDAGAKAITETMKIAAAHTIAGLVEHPSAGQIIPSVFDDRVAPAVAAAVARHV